MDTNKNLSKWVCIARTGTFTDSAGKSHTFTDADFDRLEFGYGQKKQKAALCFGHPKDSDPAFGWVHALKREGNELFAQFAHVPAEVQKLVEDKRYQHVSMSLSKDKGRLLHVGLLGAAAPAIDGLGTVSFGNGQGVTINFSAFEPELENKGENMNLEELQKQIIELQKKNAELVAENEKFKVESNSASSARADAEKKATDALAEFSAFKDKISSSTREERVRALVKSGKLEPAKEKETLSFAAALAKLADPVNFSAADGKTEEVTAEERYFRELETRQQSALAVNFAAFATVQGAASGAVDYDLAGMAGKL